MKALAITGKDQAPAVLEVADPVPGQGQVRVAVAAASVNGFDLAVAAGRVWDGMPHTFPVVLGRDFVGTVDAVGDGVDDFQVGDRVAGLITGSSLGPGAIGEYAVASTAGIAVLPDGVSITDAAAVGLAGIAGQDAIDALEVSEGDTVFIAGATGGVGSIAVQLAVAKGATVLATARPGEEEHFVLSLGAAHAVDYTNDLAAAVRAIVADGADKALHAAGDASAAATAVRSGGRLSSLLGATPELVGRDDISVVSVVARGTPEKLSRLLDHVANGRLHVQVTTTIPLDHADEALDVFAKGTLGKVLVVRR
jgi:NADPH:quinone reductase-like Zn-dependent oxidoreductase